MAEEIKRPLKVFLCHASGDKPAVRALYQRLVRDGIDAWLDKEKLLPGQDWQSEIPRAVRESDVVVICLSNKSITKEGYIQKEIKFALDIADEKPKGAIFLIPARLEECDVPAQLALWHWVDLFEADGYEWLLRSLRSRADKLGVRVGDTIYTDEESEQRLEQLYTEGLAALWVEDWQKAIHRFQAILREQPHHGRAAQKLDEAKRQQQLNALYTQAMEAQKNADWGKTIAALENLMKEAADYKDASSLLKEAQRKKQLSDLYQEAQRLHTARQWQAVVKVFAQINAVEPNYEDPAGLLSSAQKEAAELKRLARLNELYSQAVREMDAGRWYEARNLLVEVHKAQTGFLETERLLRKVEDQIAEVEELQKRNIQINTLYEQAHELIRSENWREALDKMEEIRKLDGQFADKDEIVEKAKTELDRQEQIIQRQNELAAMYAEAARLLKEGKYQDALDKWHEVRSVDPKYPDRQRVQNIASKKLKAAEKAIQNKPRFAIPKSIWIATISLLVFAAIFLSSEDSASAVSSAPFLGPKIAGYRLDWCYTAGEDCGKAVAAKWCKDNGYMDVVSFAADFSNTNTSAKAIGSGQICTQGCGSFKFITCLQAASRFSSLVAARAPTPVTRYHWDFDNGAQGWGGFYNLSIIGPSNGFLRLKSTGEDPQFLSPDSLQISAAATPVITIRMRIIQEKDSEGQIYFVTNHDDIWGEVKKVPFFVGKNDGAFRNYDIPMSINPYWKDVITQFRVDPTDEANAQIAIDYISVHAP